MNLKEIYSRYHCAQLAEKYKDTYEEGKKTGDFESNINHDIWIPKSFDEWFRMVKFPRIGRKNND
jgi:hypothetical protein|tara:strand:- start:567 stop:761 length:195 start_codon:yes stop_codon:yes gene_type:complete